MGAQVIAVNVQIPSATTAPVVADFTIHALRMGYFHRRDWHNLPADDWNVPGVYVLMTTDGSGSVYVGKSVKLRGRISTHNSDPQIDWQRALVCKRDRLYKTFHGYHYNAHKVDELVDKLREDPSVGNNSGIYEYVLAELAPGEHANPQLLNVRLFDKNIKDQAYSEQTKNAKAKGVSNCSNCPTCATGTNANAKRIYTPKDMEADHVTAWSKGGASTLANCEMLCIPHNRAKGNK